MKTFYDKDEYNLEDIQSLIDNEVEESIYLDFKSSQALSKSDGKKKEISKDVASFANSDGGIIIYGLTEENHKADSLSFIDGNEFTKEWLEHVVNSSIQRRINEIEIIPIRKENDISKSIYIVKIPKSLDAPHLSRDKRFYKRFNFESVPMEEHEIRQLYGRKVKSKLILDRWRIRRYEIENEVFFKFLCEVDIYNEGDISESEYKVNVIFENFNPRITLSWQREKSNYDYTLLGKGRMKISANSNMPIFPQEALTVLRFTLELPKNEPIKLDEVKVEIRLFYSNGEDKMETDLSSLGKIYLTDENK